MVLKMAEVVKLMTGLVQISVDNYDNDSDYDDGNTDDDEY